MARFLSSYRRGLHNMSSAPSSSETFESGRTVQARELTPLLPLQHGYEHRVPEPCVGGSNPPGGAKKPGGSSHDF